MNIRMCTFIHIYYAIDLEGLFIISSFIDDALIDI